jgi:L-ascorbate metabolism protein UlaG (beta-lactamase superfamily)
LGNHFLEIKTRFAPLRLALLPIGAYLPRWFMQPIHLSPEDAVEAHHILDAQVSVAIHFGTFPLGDDGEFEPVTKLREVLSRKVQGCSPFWVLERGEGKTVPLTRSGLE